MTTTDPPATFDYYHSQVSPYALLGLLHDHGIAKPLPGEDQDPGADRAHALRELAMSAAVVRWWSGWMPGTAHRALLAGADLADVTAAMGCTVREVFEAWLPWAEGQVGLWRHTSEREPRPLGVSPDERDQVLARFEAV